MTLTLRLTGLELPDGMSDRALAEAAATGVMRGLQRHFRRRNATRAPRPGFPKSDYWQDAAESVRVEVRGTRCAAVVEKEGVALHVEGGTVRPAKAKAFAIPLSGVVAGVYARHAHEELGYRPAKDAGKAGFLVDPKTGEVLYLLCYAAHHRPDPSAVPTAAELEAAAAAYCEEASDGGWRDRTPQSNF